MNQALTGWERCAATWAGCVHRRPWTVIFAFLLLAVIAATGLGKLQFSGSFRAYFGPGNPEMAAFEELEATYAKSDNILFVVRPTGGDVFVPEALETVERLTAGAWRLPYATRVDSLTNFPYSHAAGDDLVVEDLIRNAAGLDPVTLARRRAVALAEPALAGLLIDAAATTAGVNVVFQFPEEEAHELPRAVAAARALAARLEEQSPGTEIALSGVAMLNHAFSEAGERDSRLLMPVMFTVLIAFLAVALRSLWATVATLAVLAASVVVALGLGGHLGIRLSPVAITAPTIILTLAIADSVHILTTVLTALRRGLGRADAVARGLAANVVPVTVTTVTTIVGFLALNFADTPPFHDLGNLTALGIGAAWLGSLTLLPALLTVLPLAARARADAAAGRLEGGMDRLGGWVVRHHRPMLAVAVLLLLGSALGMSRLELDDQWMNYFDSRVEFRRDAETTHRHLTGLYLVELSVPAGEAEGIHAPEYLARLDRYSRWLRAQPEVRHVTVYTDVVKRLHANLNGDDPAFYALPGERGLAAQYLLLYELSLPFGLDLNDRIAVDRSATRVTALVDGEATTAETRALLARSDRWFEDHAPPPLRPTASGLGVLFAHISERNIAGMLGGNVAAVVLIAVILIAALRSLGLGLLSLVPNTVPILVTFGIWALVAGRVGMAGAMVSVVALGIVVDDTVHFLAHYLRARRRHGHARREAIRSAFRSVGVAIVSTTAILATGFLVLALSTFRINSELGLLTAIAVVVALVTDLFLLPALLLIGHPADQTEATRHDQTATATG